ncbi:MAG TPA: AMP-binding protein [Marmoricola sp.]|nr:AMP-binding protein [Marmoricola sp.]
MRARTVTGAVTSAALLAKASVRFERPDRLPRAMMAMATPGNLMTRGLAGATARYPLAPAVVDDDGSLSYGRLWTLSDAAVRVLHDRGVRNGGKVGLLARNHRGFVLGMVAAWKLGADVVFMNTGFAGPQLDQVLSSEAVDVLLHDDEFADVVRHGDRESLLAVSLAELASEAGRRWPAPTLASMREGRSVILTSGTTGRPKGASRGASSATQVAAPLLASLPIRSRDTVVIAAPLFHAWGLAHLGMGIALSSTAVLAPSFDAEATLRAVEEHRADALVVVPVMLQRILALGGDVLARYDTSTLRYIAASGSALGAPLAAAALNRFGPVLYNVYGSTEVAIATVARPRDLRREPGTAGRVATGSVVRVLDDSGRPVPEGETGRIFVGSGSRFEGYTDGGGKEVVDGLVSSGDMGHFDRSGLLFVDGRDDDMIVSGGENVYPFEVEELLTEHPEVAEAAVVGVPDPDYGQRLKAFVVPARGATLDADGVRDFVRSRLARHKVPRDVAFVDELPRNPTGKLLRKDLA